MTELASWVLPGDADDREILSAARRSEQLNLLYRRYAPALRNFCRSRLGGDDAAADDACHETVLKAYGALPGFRPGARMWPWLSTIAARVCIDMQRDQKRIDLHAEPPERSSAPGPEDIAGQRSRSRLFRDAMGRMGTRQRTYIYLKDVEGWSYDEIADADHTTVGAVRTTLHRGRRQLRDHVATLARERHEWPLPAILPVAWWRIRGRVAQLRDWAARLDPSAAVSSLLGSAPAQASVAIALLAGLATTIGAPPADSRPAVVPAAVGHLRDAAAAGVVTHDDATDDDATPPAPATTVAGAGVHVEVQAGVEKTHQGNRDVYELGRASAAPTDDRPTVQQQALAGVGMSYVCPPPEQRAPVSLVVCGGLEATGDD